MRQWFSVFGVKFMYLTNLCKIGEKMSFKNDQNTLDPLIIKKTNIVYNLKINGNLYNREKYVNLENYVAVMAGITHRIYQ